MLNSLLRFKKKNPLFVLGVSNSECVGCCYSEPLLKKIHNEFSVGNFMYKGRKIPVVRVDMAKESKIFDKEGVLFE